MILVNYQQSSPYPPSVHDEKRRGRERLKEEQEDERDNKMKIVKKKEEIM